MNNTKQAVNQSILRIEVIKLGNHIEKLKQMKKQQILYILFIFTFISCENREDSHVPLALQPVAVTLNITLPDADFQPYQERRIRATMSYHLRGVLEVYEQGTNKLVERVEQELQATPTIGVYTLDTEIMPGKFDFLLWIDYTDNDSNTDLWYDTQSLRAVKIISDNKTYTAGSATRETAYQTFTQEVSEKQTKIDINTIRPQAKFILYANDIIRYNELQQANPDKYVPLSELEVQLVYTSYLPDGFNVSSRLPNSSALGYKYDKVPLPPVSEDDNEVKLTSGYLFATDEGSSVTASLLITDKEGELISQIDDIKIVYKRNMVSILRGDFLTAGVLNPGINIDTDWDGDFTITLP